MLVLHSPEHGWKKCRCRECAGEAVPELPELKTTALDGVTLRNTDAKAFVKVGALVPLDVKQSAAGRDD
jgi:hypothetical protein